MAQGHKCIESNDGRRCVESGGMDKTSVYIKVGGGTESTTESLWSCVVAGGGEDGGNVLDAVDGGRLMMGKWRCETRVHVIDTK